MIPVIVKPWFKSKKFWAMIGSVISTLAITATQTHDWKSTATLITAQVTGYIFAQAHVDANS